MTNKQYIADVLANGGEFYAEVNIICPYCGYERYPDYESEYCYKEGEYIETCGNCEKDFNIETNVSITYTMTRIESEGSE